MIFRDRLILTNHSWGIRNVDILFDILYLSVLSVLSIGLVVLYSSVLLVPLLVVIISAIGYFFLVRTACGYIYWIGLLSDALLGFLILPLVWMNPIFLSFSILLSWGILFGARYWMRMWLPFSIIMIAIQGLFMTIIGMEPTVEAFSLSQGDWAHKDWIPNFERILPLLGEGNENLYIALSWLGFFPFCMGVFRRYSVMIVGGLMFLWVYMNIYQPSLSLDMRLLYTASYSGIFFGIYLLPGRNHYSKISSSFIALGLLFGVSFFRSEFGAVPQFLFLGMVLYFLVEAMISEIFYGKGRRKRQV